MTSEQDIKKIREMMEFLVKQEISKELNKLTLKEKGIYNLTGDIGQREIRKKLKVSADTVSNTWKKLEKKGLLKKEGKGYGKVV